MCARFHRPSQHRNVEADRLPQSARWPGDRRGARRAYQYTTRRRGVSDAKERPRANPPQSGFARPDARADRLRPARRGTLAGVLRARVFRRSPPHSRHALIVPCIRASRLRSAVFARLSGECASLAARYPWPRPMPRVRLVNARRSDSTTIPRSRRSSDRQLSRTQKRNAPRMRRARLERRGNPSIRSPRRQHARPLYPAKVPCHARYAAYRP